MNIVIVLFRKETAISFFFRFAFPFPFRNAKKKDTFRLRYNSILVEILCVKGSSFAFWNNIQMI